MCIYIHTCICVHIYVYNSIATVLGAYGFEDYFFVYYLEYIKWRVLVSL